MCEVAGNYDACVDMYLSVYDVKKTDDQLKEARVCVNECMHTYMHSHLHIISNG